MTPCQKLLKQEGTTARRIERMQQSSATPKNVKKYTNVNIVVNNVVLVKQQ